MNERSGQPRSENSEHEQTDIHGTALAPDESTVASRWTSRLVTISIVGTLLFLLVLSLGSGWTFPRLLPDRIDAGPWRQGLADRGGLMRSVVTSICLSLTTAVVSTGIGFLLARCLRHASSLVMLYLLYVPFVISPVIAGICLYDLAIRLHLAGTFSGVLLTQCLFATSFATICFRSTFGNRIEKLENLVRTLGGGRLTVWRHAVWPQMRGMVGVCLIQTAMYSWLDYGLVSVIGGGRIVPLTLRLFAYIREASTNQAAMASILLMLPAIAGLLWAIVSGRALVPATSVALEPCLSSLGDDVRSVVASERRATDGNKRYD
jgi:putative spermidine/putrescine transport system permease protein